MIVVPARWKALRIAIRSVAPRSISSRNRSKTSTLLSTAMPTVSARPAKPKSVKAALMEIMIAISINMFRASTITATMPAKR